MPRNAPLHAAAVLGDGNADVASAKKTPRRAKKTSHSDESDNKKPPEDPDDEAPERPTDERPPVPIRDPPSDDSPKPPLTVG